MEVYFIKENSLGLSRQDSAPNNSFDDNMTTKSNSYTIDRPIVVNHYVSIIFVCLINTCSNLTYVALATLFLSV